MIRSTDPALVGSAAQAGGPVRILVINPNATEAMTEEIGAAARRYARPGTSVEAVTAPFGPPSIESHAEEVLAAVAVIETVMARGAEFDGIVVACFDDPGLDAARELTTVPVVGIGEAAMLTALPLGHRFSVVAALDRSRPLMMDVVDRHGLGARCASVRTAGLGVLDIERDPAAAVDAIVAAAQRAIDEDGAEVICLGCAGMGMLDEQVRARLPVPVIDGTVAAVKLLEGLIDTGAATSRQAAYVAPDTRTFAGPDGGEMSLRAGGA